MIEITENRLESPCKSFFYMDLEINDEDQIYWLGLHSDKFESDWKESNLDDCSLRLISLKEQGQSLCGHNFRRFDYPHLLKRFPHLDPWLVVDTLELQLLPKSLSTVATFSKPVI